jgi:tetratricopeptide (TPR) repeat protein
MTTVKKNPPAIQRETWLRSKALMAGVIGLLVVIVYANTLKVPFLFDDQGSIAENTTIQKFSLAIFSPPHGGVTVEGRPLLNVSLALNYLWGGLDPRGYHATNIAIHLAAALIFFGLVRRTLKKVVSRFAIADQATEIAAAAALLWALHPLQTESVTYVVQRTESLMGLLYLLTLYGFVRGCDAEKSRRWFTVSVVACTLGMATKEVMVSAPLMVLLYDRTFVAGSFREAWRRRRGWYLWLAASWIVLAYLVASTGLRGGTIGASAGVTWWQYAMSQSRAIVCYLGLALWPRPLIFDYGSDFVTFGEIFPYAVLDLVLLGGTAVALWRRPALGFLGAWFFLILAPTSSVVGGTRQMLAEHRMYLSLGTVAVMAAVGLHLWLGRRAWVAWSALVILLGVATVRRNEDYRSELSIYADTVAKRPGNGYARNNLGKALISAGRYTEAVEEFSAALRLSPPRTLAMAHNYLASALAKAGRLEEALKEAEIAVKLNPNYVEARYNYGNGFMRLRQPRAAIAQFEAALKLRPNYPEAQANLGVALAQAGRSAEAIGSYEEALRLNPNSSEAHYNLASAQQQLKQFTAAIENYEAALRLRPDYPEAHNNLGLILMELQRLPAAMEHYRAALKAKPDYPEALYNMGSALSQLNQWPQAVVQFEAAIRLNPNNTQAHLGLGNAFCATGRAAQAISHYEIAVRAFPNNLDLQNNLGSALVESGRPADAIAHFTAALRLKPDSAETHCNLAVALADQGDRAEAIRHLEEALRLKPDYAYARDLLAQLGGAPR